MGGRRTCPRMRCLRTVCLRRRWPKRKFQRMTCRKEETPHEEPPLEKMPKEEMPEQPGDGDLQTQAKQLLLSAVQYAISVSACGEIREAAEAEARVESLSAS